MDSPLFSILGIGLEVGCASLAIGNAAIISRLQDSPATLARNGDTCREHHLIDIPILRMGNWLEFKTYWHPAHAIVAKVPSARCQEYACVIALKKPNPASNQRRWQEKLSREDFDG